MTKVHDEMLEHEFDGIREYDNPPPGWIMWMLYTSIVFAVGYWLYYQTFAVGHQPTRIYEAEMARAAEVQLERMAKQELSDATLQLMAAVPAQVDEGRKIFEQFCVVCHGAAGEGSVGPNLTDSYWIHGGAPMSIWRTVTNGVTDKGMAAWAGQLGPARVQKVVAFVLTLKDTNRPGKAPQGEPETAAPAPAAAAAAAATSPAQARS
jgi:cytochrome c oxidase cbb3-type subunit 3